MDILGPDRGKMTIYGSDFQQVNLTPNGGVSPTVDFEYSLEPPHCLNLNEVVLTNTHNLYVEQN